MSMTPYAAAKIVNAALLEANVEKVIPPQMMYNYTTARIRKGKAPFIKTDAEGRITEAGLAEWLEKYLAKQGVEVTAPVEDFSV
jgi:hypothetical protein